VSAEGLQFFRDHLRRGDRYAFQFPAGDPSGGVAAQPLIEASSILLLPATRVADPAKADVLLSYGVDPRGLGLPRPSVQLGDQPFYVTRLHG
jgi:hypothetical protein